jgi:2-oxo-3-hexenedioate decarboxylase
MTLAAMSSQHQPDRFDPRALAQELVRAYTTGAAIAVPPSARDASFDLNTAYAVEEEFKRARLASGRKVAGVKVGYANKAMWRVLKLETLVWAHMYDDTVHYAGGGTADYTLPPHRAPKIEPEIVFRLRELMVSDDADAASALQHVEWLAVGFEVIDCPFPDWQFKPADFIAAFGLHLGLVVGDPVPVTADSTPALAESLASFKLRVSRNGELVEEGSGKNSLRSPALCLAELGAAVRRRNGVPLGAGELISSGTLTSGHLIARGETWQADVDSLPVPPLTVRIG